jgi:phosphoribosylformylglycinamidine synthase subunit PurL
MAIAGETGFDVSLDKIPNSCSSIENLIFSESACRYIVGTDDPGKVQKLLSAIDGLEYSEIGSSTGKGSDVRLSSRKMTIPVSLSYEDLVRRYGILDAIMEQNFKD